jgi:hypothetical protein
MYGIQRFLDIRAGRADVTYHLNTTQVAEVRSNDDDFSYVPHTGNCTLWNSLVYGQVYGQLDSILLVNFSTTNNSLWNTVLNGSDAAAFYSLDVAATIAERVYNTYYTQYYNVVLREHNTVSSTNETMGLVRDENWERLVQSKLSTRILQALLAAMWLCTTIALILFDTKNLLPKNPCSIAAQASLLADSRFLDLIPAGAENASAKELMQMSPFVDHEFSMGWWDDDNGGRRFGIDVGVANFDRNGDEVNEEEVEDSA